MEYIEFGCNKKEVSVIGLGTMRIPSLSIDELTRLLNTSTELGINLLDTADIYGRGQSEQMLGVIFSKNPKLREQFFLQSKCAIRIDPDFTYYDFDKNYILQSVDESLKRLQTDHLDSLLLHRPDIFMDPEEIGEAFNELRRSGKVLEFGVSNMSYPQMRLLRSGLDCELACNQLQLSICHTPIIDAGFNVNMTNDKSVQHGYGVLEYSRLHNITIQAWSVLQYGFFEGVFIDSPLYERLNQVLQRIADEQNVNKTAVALAWILKCPTKMQAIVGSTKDYRLKESALACKVQLTKKQWYEIYLSAGNTLP